MTFSSRPKRPRIRAAFGAIWMPAPTSAISRTRSSFMDRQGGGKACDAGADDEDMQGLALDAGELKGIFVGVHDDFVVFCV